MELKKKIIAEIKKIYDPEIPVNIYELGLIYDIKIDKDNNIKVDMTLTTPNCPVAESLPKEVKDSIMEVKGVKKVEDISFEGSGCAISMASASIMTELVKGKEEGDIKEIVNDFLDMIKENPELNSKNLKDEEKIKLMCLSGVKQYPMRVKCATLSWHTLTSAIDNIQEETNTEKMD